MSRGCDVQLPDHLHEGRRPPLAAVIALSVVLRSLSEVSTRDRECPPRPDRGFEEATSSGTTLI